MAATRGRSTADAELRASGLRLAMERKQEPPAEKEHAMMFAFALAIVGTIVLGSIELVAYAHAH